MEVMQAMIVEELMLWAFLGLVAGALAILAMSVRTLSGFAGALGAGLLGGLAGGWSWTLAFSLGATSAFGSIILGLAVALAVPALLHTIGSARRHT
jgi:hypothetical protein